MSKVKFSGGLNLFLKLTLLIVLILAIYFDLTAKGNLQELWFEFLKKTHGNNLKWLILACFLIPFNWLAETQKWHQFVSRYQKFSKWQAYKAVLAGVSFSLFTPNRVGEYGGRILFVQRKNQWKRPSPIW